MRQFPIQGGQSIPWSLIAPHEAQAQSNHDQSLERLAERGGLDPWEALAVIGHQSYAWAASHYTSGTSERERAQQTTKGNLALSRLVITHLESALRLAEQARDEAQSKEAGFRHAIEDALHANLALSAKLDEARQERDALRTAVYPDWRSLDWQGTEQASILRHAEMQQEDSADRFAQELNADRIAADAARDLLEKLRTLVIEMSQGKVFHGRLQGWMLSPQDLLDKLDALALSDHAAPEQMDNL